MTQNVEKLPFFERFQQPITRRTAMVTFGTALGAAALTLLSSFLRIPVPQVSRAQAAETPKQNLKSTPKATAVVTRHPGPVW
jgi:hypothetical protein